MHYNKLWLVPIPSLPIMPLHGSYVVVGSSIFVMGIFYHWGMITSMVSRIDCRSHTVQRLTRMPQVISCSASGIIYGKIYVIGGSNTRSPELKSSSNRVMVFDTKTQTCEARRPNREVDRRWFSSVEMKCNIYMRGYKDSYFYEAKEGTYETDAILHSKEWSNSCVIDDILYYYDVRKNFLRTYDPEDGSWSYSANYGGKLVVFLQKVVASAETTEIWCVEIAVEKHEGGEIWEKVEWYDLVFDGKSSIMKCLAVRI